MDRTNLELFKQAIRDGICKRCDSIAAECAGEITCSDGHSLAMRTIVYGKIEKARSLSPRARQIIAILVAAALLLTGCGIIFRNEIREVFDDVFVSLYFTNDDETPKTIEEIYTLGYVPEGYVLEEETIGKTTIIYNYFNEESTPLTFEQRVFDSSEIVIDSEEGYSNIMNISGSEIYYRFTNNSHIYIWNNGKYVLKLKTSEEFEKEKIVLMIESVTTK